VERRGREGSVRLRSSVFGEGERYALGLVARPRKGFPENWGSERLAKHFWLFGAKLQAFEKRDTPDVG